MTVEEAIERVREKRANPNTANGVLFIEALRLLDAEVERLRGEVATLKARLDYPPAALEPTP